MDVKFSYRNLDVYRNGKDLVRNVYGLLKGFPKEENYALCDQIRRAVISVPSNIAEGLNRFSDKEKVHFIEIAYGSLMEIQCQLDIARDLGYISEEEFKGIDGMIDRESRLLSGLRNKYLYPNSSKDSVISDNTLQKYSSNANNSVNS